MLARRAWGACGFESLVALWSSSARSTPSLSPCPHVCVPRLCRHTRLCCSRPAAPRQVALWVAIGLALALIAAVFSILFMNVGRDPVLYSQFKNENDMKRD
jgi:hypothetical protein